MTTEPTTIEIAEATRIVPASAEDIFELLASPAQHALIDGSGTVKGAQRGTPERLSPGADLLPELLRDLVRPVADGTNGMTEAVLLSTCNRFEIYGLAHRGPVDLDVVNRTVRAGLSGSSARTAPGRAAESAR